MEEVDSHSTNINTSLLVHTTTILIINIHGWCVQWISMLPLMSLWLVLTWGVKYTWEEWSHGYVFWFVWVDFINHLRPIVVRISITFWSPLSFGNKLRRADVLFSGVSHQLWVFWVMSRYNNMISLLGTISCSMKSVLM